MARDVEHPQIHAGIDADLDLRRPRPDVFVEKKDADVYRGDEPRGEYKRENRR